MTIRSSKPSKREERSVSAGSAASSSTSGLVEGSSLRRQRDHALTGLLAVHGVERGRDDVDSQHHPGAAAGTARRRPGRLAAASCRGTLEPQLELGAENGGNRPLLGHPGEGVRDLGEDVEAHGRRGLLVGVREAAGDETGLRRDRPRHAGVDERQQETGVELERVVGGAVVHVSDSTERRPPSSSTARPTSWKT